MVESGVLRGLPIRVLTVPCEGDQQHVPQSRLLSNPPRHLQTVHDRQANIEEHRVGRKLPRHAQSALSILSHADIVAHDREESCNASGHIRIVLNDQHPERMTRRLYDLARINGSLASRGVQ